ncbi:MAG: DUF2207 domain-containing protein [Oscillospiraceae bacterium]|nr:DUF2207 domain-containing protein [Oscillospiraceae bacterium]
MRKKLAAVLAAMILTVCVLAMPAAASEAGYTIENYYVNAQLNENNTIDITEQLDIYFDVASHGFYRTQPQIIYMTRFEEDGTEKEYRYSMDLEDINVEGAPYEILYEDENTIIQVGDADRYVTGLQSYTLTYTIDMGDDRVDAYDELSYNLLGTDWGTVIRNFSFDFTFPKDTDFTNLNLFCGTYGSTDSRGLTYSIEGNTVSGYCEKSLQPYEGVTIYTKLPAGYFTGTSKLSPVSAIVCLVLSALCGVFAFFRIATKKRNKKIVQTVEFYPPEDMSSAEVGYVIDGSADDKDILSLIIWLADKGYIEISTNKADEILVRKRKDIEKKMPRYIRLVMEGLFSDKYVNEKSKKTSEEKWHNLTTQSEILADNLETAKESLRDAFTGPRELNDASAAVPSYAAALGAVVFGCVGIYFTGGGLYFRMLCLPIVMAVVLVLFAFSVYNYIANRQFASKKSVIFLIVLTAIYVLLSLPVISGAVLFSPIISLLLCIAPFVGVVIGCSYHSITDYKADTVGKLLGLKQFIKTAELDKLERLVEDDPSYFFNILPYAYVFNLTDKWAKKFENIPLAVPTWYQGNNMDTFSYMWLSNRMYTNLNNTANAISSYRADQAAHSSTSGGSGGTSFGGGGGSFSGGGFGGGGGGRW